jgi:hypothetical protein
MRNPRAAWLRLACLSVASTSLVLLLEEREAGAVPSFARKYQTSCTTCHTVYPMLNPFGEAFRRNGYRFPTQGDATDTDATKSTVLALGQEEFKKRFPDAVWPSSIAQEIPFSVMLNGGVTYNIPGQDAHEAADHAFDWAGLVQEFHIFGAGSFNDNLTYFTEVNTNASGISIEIGYLLWNDILGPGHAVNLWLGRLAQASLTSFGSHSSYIADTMQPTTSVQALFNPTGLFVLGQQHVDGMELNGVLAHRFDYAIGWAASGAVPNLRAPNAEDAYAHVGVKLGGMSLDGEGADGVTVADPNAPWSETSLTLDLFGFHGKTVLDNGTGVGAAVRQDDAFNAVGGAFRLALGSLLWSGGVQYEQHKSPFQGGAATPPVVADPTAKPPVVAKDAAPGTPDTSVGKGFVQYSELDYVVWPWFVPGVRVDYTAVSHAKDSVVTNDSAAHILRVVPGIAMLVRPNIKVLVTAAFERASGAPAPGAWAPASWQATGASTTTTDAKVHAETISAMLFVAY